MNPAARIALISVAILLAAIPAWLAGTRVAANLAVSSWQRAEGVVTISAADDSVEIELPGEPAATRVTVPVDHHLGLPFLKRVPVRIDPADSRRVRTAGLLQMWAWPAALALAAGVLLAFAAVVARAGPPPPPPLTTDIRVYRPASEWKVPLFWSLLGAALLVSALLTHEGSEVQRTLAGGAGTLFLLLMWGLAVDNKTTEISADANVLRRTSAFGWREVRWDEVASVTRERTVFGRPERLLRAGTTDFFPGREVTTVVFRGRSGRALIRMSPAMQPPHSARDLLNLCAERTGLHLESRTNYERNL